jgi:glycosyltransferase involved in cell wall biosynthesis
MRILYTIPSLGQGGAERQLTYLAAGMRALGHIVEVAVLRSGVHRNGLHASGAEVHTLGPLEDCQVALRRDIGHYSPALLRRLVGVIRRARPDVTQSCLMQMDVLTGLASKITGTSWLLRESSSGNGTRKSPKLWLRRMLAKSAAGVIANSRAGAASWMRSLPRRSVTYIPNGIRCDEIEAAAPADVRAYAMDDDTRLVVYAGRFVSCKNISNLLSAAATVVERQPEVRFLLAGEGPERRAAEDEVKRRGLADRIRFAGFVPDPWPLMKRAAAMVSVSRFEGAPNSVLEAMAAGCPLVVSDIPAHREILDESSAAFAAPESADGIAAAIEGVLRAPERARERAERARGSVRTYSVDTMALRYEAVYRAVSGGGQ